MKQRIPQPLLRQFDDSGGGGLPDDDHDPRDRDIELACHFKQALGLMIAHRSSTPNPFGLINIVQEIMKRADSAILLMLDESLRPIVTKLREIHPGDREIPGCIENKFQGFDLTL